ncbi:hypothetical protein CO661_01400 [Sinorhizobium fredii]|uniref:Uncharacterized protein n=1 Tax=Rhizobium fredii TaxID=380 RepID=A0A2A6M7M2_RHIFR|nr:hypothetical protein CO661_01400 [Sinorhizobium fredii]
MINSPAATRAATPLLSTGRASRPAARRLVRHRCRRRYVAAPCPGDERPRIELIGFTDGMRDWLKSIGLLSEMISGRMLFFVPMTEEGPAIPGRRIEWYRLIDVVSRT